ncbi:MAG: LacI family DNA-binding transcriptional regulator, partial [Candidatus Omnitrophica bacterium]|nr:LacI family DNA-binding transcriptional regulator [Candidatus Omnitrophota bacterium]
MRRGLEGIAKKLGLSIATISRALNPSTEHLVKEKTKKRIFDLVQKEGFKPNIKARFLAKMKLNNIVLALPIGV